MCKILQNLKASIIVQPVEVTLVTTDTKRQLLYYVILRLSGDHHFVTQL